MPNQLGIDSFDLDDAEGAQADHMCSADLRAWMAEWHLDLTLGVEGDGPAAVFNPREAFGSHSDSDHVYNTPRAWYMQRCLNPSDVWDGPEADYTPESDDIPWSRVPERKVTIEDIKYVLSSHYQARSTTATAARARPPRVALSPHRHQPQQPARCAAAAPLCASGLPRRAVDGLWLQLV